MARRLKGWPEAGVGSFTFSERICQFAVDGYPVIEISRAVMDCFGGLKAELSSKGISVDDFDLLIGCSALVLNYTVVTNNTKHFEKIEGLKLQNWTV